MINQNKIKKIKKIFLTIFFLFFIFNINTNAEVWKCNIEYIKKLRKCEREIRVWNYKSLDFICTQQNSWAQLFNIIMDDLFKVVDKQAKNSLYFLEKNKDYYFKIPKSWEKTKNFMDWIDDIDKDFWEFWKYDMMYKTICKKTLIEDFASCKDIAQISELRRWYNQKCMKLAKIKLNIYKSIAYNTLIMNKLQLRKDNRKTFMQTTRQSYSNLLKLFDTNINYIERIAFKWKVKIKNGYLP